MAQSRDPACLSLVPGAPCLHPHISISHALISGLKRDGETVVHFIKSLLWRLREMENKPIIYKDRMNYSFVRQAFGVQGKAAIGVAWAPISSVGVAMYPLCR